jgi:hypothetical protein
VLLASVGLGFGAWGLKSPKRRPAIVGMLMCCIAFAIGVARLAYRGYVHFYSP